MAGEDRRSVQPMAQAAASVASGAIERRPQTLAAQASRAAEEERQHVFVVAQHHGPTCGALLVTVAYHRRVIDPCAPGQGAWLDGGQRTQVLAEEA